ncbi:excalibur calcium-binding domain-containing protein [Microvirga sp. KLBC 81]|uniref:excalibur calcium-binding domain-containing protein n=1 Tax=Microvirga sp. KLBC 81 TaxID=1862707 RepID=UPI00197BE17B|nr:excalibur calcium-binding domain-containing protein [Microvirga sp. KLBC 81]
MWAFLAYGSSLSLGSLPSYFSSSPSVPRVHRFGGSGSFRTCAQARAAGAAPIARGNPDYAPHLDADGDGIACEWYWRNWFR